MEEIVYDFEEKCLKTKINVRIKILQTDEVRYKTSWRTVSLTNV